MHETTVTVNGSSVICGLCGGQVAGHPASHDADPHCGALFTAVKTDHDDEASFRTAVTSYPHLPYRRGGFAEQEAVYADGWQLDFSPWLDRSGVGPWRKLQEVISGRPGIGTQHLLEAALTSEGDQRLAEVIALYQHGYKFGIGSLADDSWWTVSDSAEIAYCIKYDHATPGLERYRRAVLCDETRSSADREWILRNT